MELKDKMIAHFDAAAENWGTYDCDFDKREQLCDMMGLQKGMRIADIGCGKGVFIPHLLKYEPDSITAIDISPKMIALAKNRFCDEPRVSFVCCDLPDAPLCDIDVAIVYNAYPHFTDKMLFAKKLFVSLKPKGELILCHSRGRSAINDVHNRKIAPELSVGLESPQGEELHIKEYFTLKEYVDTDELYFARFIATMHS